ncbi:carboxypeptidase A4-like [Sarcophilus harrisii]
MSWHQVFQIKVQDGNQIEKLKELSNIQNSTLTFWNLPVNPEHPVNVVVPPASLELVKSFLESHGLEYSVSIKDLQALFDKQIKEMKFNRRKAKRDTNFNYGDYHNLDELYREMINIASEYPYVAKLLKIGDSFEKRPLYVLKIASDFSENKPTITSILNEMDIFLMPVANPDGYVYSQTKDPSWRKNRSYKRFKKCIGVDLNRNWDVAFSIPVPGKTNSDDPCSPFYRGPGPNSEVEVEFVANFISKHGNFKSFIDFHSFSQLLMYPYGYISNKCPDCAELDKLAKDAVKALYSLFGTRYQVGSIYKTVYPVGGSTIDWAYKNGIKYAFTFELRDTGKHGFILPVAQIIPTAQETWLALEVIMKHVKDHLY